MAATLLDQASPKDAGTNSIPIQLKQKKMYENKDLCGLLVSWERRAEARANQALVSGEDGEE